MKFRTKLFAGLVSAFALAAGFAIAQVPALFVTSLTGTEQINVLVPSTGTVTTNPQTQVVTTKVLAAYVNGQGGGVDAQTGTSYTVVASDLGKLVTLSNASAIAVTLPQATGSFGAGSTLTLSNIGAGAATITPTTSTINGASTFVLNQNRSATLFSDGTNWQVDTGGSGLQVTPATIAEGGTNAATTAAARTSLAVPGIATTNTFTGTLNQFGSGSGTPGHLATGQTTAPALTSCGTGSPAITGTDTAGVVTVGTSATGCIITFNVAYTAVPYCAVSWQANLASMQYTVTATAITLVQTSTSSNKVNFICVGQSGG